MASDCDSKTMIMGYSVLFPNDRRPFSPQLALMSKVLTALNNKNNALLESPTGTGKTFALLTSTLCWQLNNKINDEDNDNKEDDDDDNSAETTNYNRVEGENIKNIKNINNILTNKKKKKIQIIYCSRTHSQLNQVIKEIHKLHAIYKDNLKMTILASRGNSCINEKIKQQSIDGVKSIDENCKDINKKLGCYYNINHRISNVVTSLNKMSVWDIEDSIVVGKKNKGCPYYSSRSMIQTADLILAPYNFVLDSNIRSTVKLDLSDSIIIFDEAHNIEEVARSVNSIEINHSILLQTINQLQRLLDASTLSFKHILQFLNDIYLWFVESVDSLKHNSTTELVWNGGEILNIFNQRFGFNESIFNILNEHLQTILTEQDDIVNVLNNSNYNDESIRKSDTQAINQIDYDVEKLDNQTTMILKSLFRIFLLIFSNQNENSEIFQFVIEKNKFSNYQLRKQKFSITSQYDEYNLNIWCLNAAIAFKEIDSLCHSILLTSGTLSPLTSFINELGIPFPIKVETNHIINKDKQIKIFAVKHISNVIYNFTYSNQNNTELMDSLGSTLDQISSITPGGTLMFFPSYSLMDRIYQRWDSTGLLFKITGVGNNPSNINQSTNKCIPIYMEPRDAKSTETILSSYYDSINSYNGRAILLAVCRGKISEGIDFSNDYARAVLIVGIPFPSLYDTLIKLKKQYLDQQIVNQQNSGNCADCYLDGNTWYNQQAYRAINQAIGRCIRHQYDYGAIILLDQRFHNSNTQINISKWLKSSIVNHNNFYDTIKPLTEFFDRNTKELNTKRYDEYYNTNFDLMHSSKDRIPINDNNNIVTTRIITSDKNKRTSISNNSYGSNKNSSGILNKPDVKKIKIEDYIILKSFQNTKKPV